jgi:hypothetical protein
MVSSEQTKGALDTRRVTRAISIRQPYVEKILRGIKTREYRSVRTNIRERVYLYASATLGDRYDYQELGVALEDLPRGLLVGTVEVIGCEPDRRNGGYAYLLANPIRLSQPLKPKNKPQPIWFRPF